MMRIVILYIFAFKVLEYKIKHYVMICVVHDTIQYIVVEHRVI